MTYFRYDNPRDKRLIQFNDDPDDLWELIQSANDLPNKYFVTYRFNRFPQVETSGELKTQTNKFLNYHQRLADVSKQCLFPIWAYAPMHRHFHFHSTLMTTMTWKELAHYHIQEWRNYPHNWVNIKESIKPLEDVDCLSYIFGKEGPKVSHIQGCFRSTFLPGFTKSKRKPFPYPGHQLAKTRAYRATAYAKEPTKPFQGRSTAGRKPFVKPNFISKTILRKRQPVKPC